MNMFPRRAWLFVAIAALLVAGCQRTDVSPGASQQPAGTPKVAVVKPDQRKIKHSVDQPGYVRADQESPMAAKIAGYVSKVNVDIGDRVTEGQVLAEISVPELDEEVKQKQAVARQIEAAGEQAEKTVLTAKAQVEVADALVREAEAGVARAEASWQRWSSEAERMTSLAKKNVVDEQGRDETIHQAKAAAAWREETTAKVVSAKAAQRRWVAELAKAEIDVKAEQKRLKAAEADYERVKAMQQYESIRAPFPAVVTRRQVDPGYLLQLGKPEYLFVVADIRKVRVAIDVPEIDSGSVKLGDPVTIQIQALGNQPISGSDIKVTRTSHALDPQARTLRVEIDLDNKDGKYFPGAYAYVRIHIDLAPVRAVPAKALSKAGETMACFFLQDGKAVRTKVKAGRSDGEWTEVVTWLKPGTNDWVPFTGEETIIANPPPNLADGATVEVEK
jgi:HlyD family secretion protein